MLDIRIAELLGGFGCSLVGHAFGIAAIGHDQRIFVLGQNAGQLLFLGLKIDCPGNVTLFPGFGAIGIEQRNFLGCDLGFQIFDGDRGSEVGGADEGEDDAIEALGGVGDCVGNRGGVAGRGDHRTQRRPVRLRQIRRVLNLITQARN